MNYLIDNEYVNNFELLDNLFSNNMNFDNLNTNYTHAIACIEQSKRIKNKLDEMGLYSYLVTCKPDKFLSKHGDELMIESHTILVHPCLYNKKISFVIFDPGFRLKNSVLIIDKENSCDKRFYDGIYKIEYKKDNDYPYEIYTNRRTDINRNIYIKDIHWKFNLYYETINIDSLYYYFIKIMYSYKIVSYSTKYENNPYVIYNVFKDLIIYSDGYNIKEIKIRKACQGNGPDECIRLFFFVNLINPQKNQRQIDHRIGEIRMLHCSVDRPARKNVNHRSHKGSLF